MGQDVGALLPGRQFQQAGDSAMSEVGNLQAVVVGSSLMALPDALRLELAEEAIRSSTDLRLAGQLAGAADRITRHAYGLCEEARFERQRRNGRDPENLDPHGPNNPPVGAGEAS